MSGTTSRLLTAFGKNRRSQTARGELLERGIDVGEIRHKSPLTDWRGDWKPGLDANRTDYASVADFRDPDGNQWILQERGFQP
jgi:hypothetical protein